MNSTRRWMIVVAALSISAGACGLGGANVPDVPDLGEVQEGLEDLEQFGEDLEALEEELEGLDPSGGLGGEVSGDEWTVTELTGSITNTRTPGSELCPPFEDTYQPIIDGFDTYVVLARMTEFGDVTQFPAQPLVPKGEMDIPLVPLEPDAPADEPSADVSYIGAHPDANSDGVFIFSFEFDNGYHDNSVVETAQAVRTAGQFAFEAIGYYNDTSVVGMHASIAPGHGYNRFDVEGSFDGPSRMAGTWEFVEATALPGGAAAECDSSAVGSGTWAAEAR